MSGLAGRASETLIERELEESMCPSLSVRIRGCGFILCFLLGLVMGIISAIALGKTGSIVHFLVPYILAMLLMFGGSFFLVGPTAQAKKAFDAEHHRRFATISLIVSIVLTMVIAFAWGQVFVTMLITLI